MTLPLSLPAFVFKASILRDGSMAHPLSLTTALASTDLHNHFADRAGEFRTSLQTACAKFAALLAEPVVDAKEFRRLRRAAHEQAEEADALLIALVCCRAPEALIQEVETTFDRLRDLEEQITEALGRNKGLPRRSASDVTRRFSLDRPTP